ncbi:MAG: chemotaxis protein CheW [Sedimentibacter sp.]
MKNVNHFERANQMVENNSEMFGKFLTFLTENQLFAIPISDVVQIVGIQEITELPDSPHYVKGIIGLRGSIILVIDIRLRLGKIEKQYDERTCIIVSMINGKLIGFIVDEVDAVIYIEEENISGIPKVTDNSNNRYLTGIAKIDGKVVLLMDASKILSNDIITNFEDQIEGGSLL